MTNILKLSDHEAYSPKFSKMVARAQQENDGIPRYVVNANRTADKALKNPEFRKSVLADMPLGEAMNEVFGDGDAA